MANRFLDQLDTPPSASPTSIPSKSSNRFLQSIEGMKIPDKESTGKSIGRTLAQVPLGLAKAHPLSFGADLFKLATEGASRETLAQLIEEEPSINREVAESARQKAMEYLPTQQLAEELIEKHTGAPLTPKTGIQKAVRLGTTAAGFRPGTLGEKVTAGVVAPTAAKALEVSGVPEEISEAAGLIASGVTPTPKFSKLTHPSGLPKRRFEKVQKETRVSPQRAEIISEALENDFKNLSDKLLSKHKTYSGIKNDAQFKEKVGDSFQKVEDLARNIEGEINPEELRESFRKRYSSRDKKGISPDEFERAFRREIRTLNKNIPFNEFEPYKLVEQFRKNNQSLSELFEPGKSSAFNRAKKEALLEYNRAIEDIFEKKYPDTEFNDIFKFTNERWSEIKDVEQIQSHIDKAFKDKRVDFKELRKLIYDKGTVRPFKRILGDEAFKDFKQLTQDLLSVENPAKYVKAARQQGMGDLAKSIAIYTLSPKVGAAHTLSKIGKLAYQSLLDKPQLSITWKNGLDSLKSGDLKQAQKYFSQLNREVDKNTTQANGDKTNPK